MLELFTAAFPAEAVFTAAFLTGAFFTGAFLTGAFFTAAFLTAVFLTAVFLVASPRSFFARALAVPVSDTSAMEDGFIFLETSFLLAESLTDVALEGNLVADDFFLEEGEEDFVFLVAMINQVAQEAGILAL